MFRAVLFAAALLVSFAGGVRGASIVTVRPMAEGLVRGSGPRLAFTAPTAQMPMGKQALFTSELDGHGVRQLTHDALSRFLPHFSPNAKQLLYTTFLVGSYGAPNAVTVIAAYDLATARRTQLTAGGVETEGVWAPNGKQVAYGTLTGDALWLMNANGSNARVIARPRGADWNPTSITLVGDTLHRSLAERWPVDPLGAGQREQRDRRHPESSV